MKYAVVCTRGEGRDGTIYVGDSQTSATMLVSMILQSVSRFNLLSALNDIQAECGGADPKSPFFDKFKFPLIIVNLVLKEYGLRIEEVAEGDK